MQMVSIWENIKPATNLNNTLRLVFQPHLGTCGFRHGLECFWLGFKVAEFPVWCIYVKKTRCIWLFFIIFHMYIYIYPLYTVVAFHLTCICLRFFDKVYAPFWGLLLSDSIVNVFFLGFSISFLSLFHFSSSWCLSSIQLLVILAFTSVSGAAVFIIFPLLSPQNTSLYCNQDQKSFK